MKGENRPGTSVIVLFTVVLLIVSCVPQKISLTSDPEKGFIFFPPLPNPPRYQYLTTFSSSMDVEKKKSRLFEFVAGDEQEKPRPIRKAYGVDIYDGVIYVADISSGAVVTLNLKSQEFGYIGLLGSGKLIKPINVKVDRDQRILYVADNGRKQVVAFDLDGKPVAFYGKQEQFDPVDVDISGDRIFICDVQGHTIHVLDRKNGDTLFTIGSPGSGESELFHPSNICIEGDRLYVSDTTNFRIQIFDLEGNFISTFGKIGRVPGDFSRNKGVAVDKEGRIYVVDAAFENVQVFNRDFQLLLFMLGPGRESHNINLPAGIAVDYDNLSYFKAYLSPKFQAEYLLFVTSNFGANQLNVYAFGSYLE